MVQEDWSAPWRLRLPSESATVGVRRECTCGSSTSPYSRQRCKYRVPFLFHRPDRLSDVTIASRAHEAVARGTSRPLALEGNK
ncbi:unnamed protein product, partial [Prorocentrum cordatum]